MWEIVVENGLNEMPGVKQLTANLSVNLIHLLLLRG